jgi:hypothetical protein
MMFNTQERGAVAVLGSSWSREAAILFLYAPRPPTLRILQERPNRCTKHLTIHIHPFSIERRAVLIGQRCAIANTHLIEDDMKNRNFLLIPSSGEDSPKTKNEGDMIL